MHHKRLFIDKCNWFITHIIKSQIKSEKGLGELVNIHSKILKEILGNRYNNIVEALVGIEIVYINEKYSSGKFTKSYALKKNLDEGDYNMVEISTKAFRNKLKESNKRLAKESESNPVLDKINRNTLKILANQQSSRIPFRVSTTLFPFKTGDFSLERRQRTTPSEYNTKPISKPLERLITPETSATYMNYLSSFSQE